VNQQGLAGQHVDLRRLALAVLAAGSTHHITGTPRPPGVGYSNS